MSQWLMRGIVIFEKLIDIIIREKCKRFLNWSVIFLEMREDSKKTLRSLKATSVREVKLMITCMLQKFLLIELLSLNSAHWNSLHNSSHVAGTKHVSRLKKFNHNICPQHSAESSNKRNIFTLSLYVNRSDLEKKLNERKYLGDDEALNSLSFFFSSQRCWRGDTWSYIVAVHSLRLTHDDRNRLVVNANE